MIKQSLFALAALGMSIAYAASSYHVTLYRPSTVNGTELKPGDCKIEVSGDKILIKQGKTTAEAAVKVESSGVKFGQSTVSYAGTNPEQIEEIRLGGTSTKLVLGASPAPLAATASK